VGVNAQLNPVSSNPGISAASLPELLNACPYPIATVDREWNVAYTNSAAREVLFGGDNPTGKNYWDCFPDQGRTESSSKNSYQRAMDYEAPSEFIEFYPPPRDRWMSVTIRPVSDGIAIFFRDVTSERQTADALINAESLSSLGRLASAIAHEIRNPLESVTNLLYLAQQSREIDELKGYVLWAGRELDRASLIVSQTLRFNRPTISSLVSCDALVKEILSLQRARLLSARIQTDIRYLRSVEVIGKEGEIRQILSNLIMNAIDAMSFGGGRLVIRIRRTIRKRTEGTVITVADTGVGMSNYTLARSFDPFFTTKSNQGNGLGLWISRELADRHGGTLKARSSQRAGQSGSVFQLFLPLDPVSRCR
jgi:signal transduction histidine kinase